MTATIVLQNHSFLSLAFSFIGVISIIMTGLYAAFARTSVDRTIGLIFCIVITFYVVLEHIKRYLFLKKGYVSVIQISDDKMRLVYSYFSERKAQNINFSDIKSFKVIIKAGMISRLFTRGGSTSARVYNIKIIIDKKEKWRHKSIIYDTVNGKYIKKDDINLDNLSPVHH